MAGRGPGAGGPQDLWPGPGECGRWAVKQAGVGQREEPRGRGRLAGLEGRVGACWGAAHWLSLQDSRDLGSSDLFFFLPVTVLLTVTLCPA